MVPKITVDGIEAAKRIGWSDGDIAEGLGRAVVDKMMVSLVDEYGLSVEAVLVNASHSAVLANIDWAITQVASGKVSAWVLPKILDPCDFDDHYPDMVETLDVNFLVRYMTGDGIANHLHSLLEHDALDTGLLWNRAAKVIEDRVGLPSDDPRCVCLPLPVRARHNFGFRKALAKLAKLASTSQVSKEMGEIATETTEAVAELLARGGIGLIDRYIDDLAKCGAQIRQDILGELAKWKVVGLLSGDIEPGKYAREINPYVRLGVKIDYSRWLNVIEKRGSSADLVRAIRSLLGIDLGRSKLLGICRTSNQASLVLCLLAMDERLPDDGSLTQAIVGLMCRSIFVRPDLLASLLPLSVTKGLAEIRRVLDAYGQPRGLHEALPTSIARSISAKDYADELLSVSIAYLPESELVANSSVFAECGWDVSMSPGGKLTVVNDEGRVVNIGKIRKRVDRNMDMLFDSVRQGATIMLATYLT